MIPRHIFGTAEEAWSAVQRDGLATVYYRGGSAFVATAFGTGTFTRAEWEDARRGRRTARSLALVGKPEQEGGRT